MNIPKHTLSFYSFCVLLLVIGFWTGHLFHLQTGLFIAGLAAMLALLGVFILPLKQYIGMHWSRVQQVLGRIASAIILILFFYLIFTPFALLARLFRKPVMVLRKPEKKSMWVREEKEYKPDMFTKPY